MRVRVRVCKGESEGEGEGEGEGGVRVIGSLGAEREMVRRRCYGLYRRESEGEGENEGVQSEGGAQG